MKLLLHRHFKLSDYQIGLTAPPFHPRCRTATAPFFDDEFEDEVKRAARDENGDYYTVPANMKYDEWYRGFVEGDKNSLDKYNLTKNIATVSTIKKIMSSQLNQLTKNERLVLTKMTGAL